MRGNETAVVASGVHEGSVATGGYGQLARHFAANPEELGTQDARELLHDQGATLLPDRRVVLAWTPTSGGGTRARWARSIDATA